MFSADVARYAVYTVVEEGAELSDELEMLETVVDRVKEFVDKVDMMMNVDV